MNSSEVPQPGAPSGGPSPRLGNAPATQPLRPALPAIPPAAPKPGGPAKPGRAAKPAKPVRAAKAPRTPKSPTPNKRRSLKVTALVVAGVVLLGGGIWLGTAVTDPTASEEYTALDATAQSAQKDLARTIADRQSVSDELDSLKSELTTREEAADAKSTAADQHEADVKASEAALKGREAAVKKREDAVTGAEAKEAANTVGDGTWVVGVDIEPGTYKANADVGASCYWGIYTSGSNGDDIINNDIPGGGKPSVTLSAGQDFKSSRCGSWTKQ